MENLVEVKYKYVPFSVNFVHKEQKYTKSNHSRGYYFDGGEKIFRNFKKQTLVLVEKKYTELAT